MYKTCLVALQKFKAAKERVVDINYKIGHNFFQMLNDIKDN